MFRKTRIEIQTANLKHNLELLRRWNGGNFFCPMVKANAYGHGDEIVAPVVESLSPSALGVALVEEGVFLRSRGIRCPILTFAPLNPEAAKAVLQDGLTPVVGRMADLEALKVHKPKAAAIHLKFNTGMQRIGFDEGDLSRLQQWLKDNPGFKVEGVCTHLTHGEDAKEADGYSQTQFKKFLNLTKAFPGVRHGHKSATLATLCEQKNPVDVGARPGIAIYGLPHEGNLTGPGLKPVLRWVSELSYVHTIEKGESASYGAQWKAQRRSKIGVLPVGYGDGYMRALSNKGEMLFRGRRVPVVGRVCMDYTLVDLTEACGSESPQVGEEVVLLGRQEAQEISAYDIAVKASTNAYEVVTAISRRVFRKAL